MFISHRHLLLCPAPFSTHHHAGYVFLTLPTPVTRDSTCQRGSEMFNTHRTPADTSVPSQLHSNTHRALWDCFLVDPVWQRLTGMGHADSRRPVLRRKWSHRTRRGMAHALNTSVFVFTPTETQCSASGLARQLSVGTTRICPLTLLGNVCYYDRLGMFKAFIVLSHSIIFLLCLSLSDWSIPQFHNGREPIYMVVNNLKHKTPVASGRAALVNWNLDCEF